jgi:RNA polymerase sigma-70 factor, ECF subfamily
MITTDAARSELRERVADDTEFVQLTDPFRRELLAHCYRMLGSVHDAEDVVQETYLRAWRSYGGFEGRSSVRTWLYRIATSACLRAIERNGRRPLPSGLGGPSDAPERRLLPVPADVAWLQPIPDALLAAAPGDPAEVVVSRNSVRLALVAALQHLPARQRVVLILRDVLAWQAAEVAELLGTTTAAVNSALQRARAQLAQVAPTEDETSEPTEPERRALLDRYVAAFEDADIAALTKLLHDDVIWEMPPYAEWFAGREPVRRFISAELFDRADAWRMVPIGANGQPAMAVYRHHSDGRHHAHAIQVLAMSLTGIKRIVTFLDPSLFGTFGMPATHHVAPAHRH